jgi:acetyl esterase
MRLVGAVMRRLPFSSVATATDAQIARSSGAAAPEPVASILMGVRPSGVTSEDRRAGSVPVRIYRSGRPGTGKPLVLYIHGGGFVYGDLRGGDWMAGTVAKRLDAVVVSVDYRLAPKHPFPAAVEDCVAALGWAADHAAELGADAARLGVMGESAGGNLAAVVALLARDAGGPRIRHQALLYPATGLEDSASKRENADAVILTAASMDRFSELYRGDRSDWRAAPITAPSHAGLPPALVVVAGHDPLRDDGVRYAEVLEAAGVPVRLVAYPAMSHGFLNLPRFARDAVPAMQQVVRAQHRALAPRPA